MKTALVSGVTGQDGAYLAQLLLREGYRVVGTSRDAQAGAFAGLAALGIREQVSVVTMVPNDPASVLETIAAHAPAEIYNLAAQSSVGLSFERPAETISSNVSGTLNLLEAIRLADRSIRFFNAGSGECFGDTRARPADEATPFRPLSPYAVAKAAAHGLVATYRAVYGLYACTGILFNHESPLRPARFVTRKVVDAAARIAAGSGETLHLGTLDIWRDWGWAPQYVDAMWRMLQQSAPEDLVIATGRTVSLRYFVEQAFRRFGLDWSSHVQEDGSLARAAELGYGAANPARAREKIAWSAALDVDGVIAAMCAAASSGKHAG